MHKNILSEKQQLLLSLLGQFSKEYGLVGGTATALLLGHRRSIDFDLFTKAKIDHDHIRSTIRKSHTIESTLVENPNELTIVVNQVKCTFLSYPFYIKYSQAVEDIIHIPDILTLASMKVFALGKRAKWKDYVDLFFIFEQYSLSEISQKAKEMFQGEFNEKLLREQLAYFEDIDYSETIDYMPGFEKSDEEIKKTLRDISIKN